LAVLHGRPDHWSAWGNHWSAWGPLLHSMRTGENAVRAVHGVDVWEYRARNPEEAAIFDAAVTGFSLRVNAAVAAAHDFGRYGVIVDVGEAVSPVAARARDPVVLTGLDVEVIRLGARALQALKRPAPVVESRTRLREEDAADRAGPDKPAP
jgi:hypothetical protein